MALMTGYGSPTQLYDFFAYNAGGKIYNGVAFVTFNTADFISYRIAPTSQVGNRYSATAPTGTTGYELRKRAGTLNLSRTVYTETLDAGPTVAPSDGLSAVLDGPMGSVAQTLIGTFGGTAQLIQTRQEYDVRTDQKVTKLALTWNVKVYPPVGFKVKQWNGSLVEAGDLKTGVSRLALEKVGAPSPAIDMQLRFKGRTYRIKSILPVYSGEKVAMYEMMIG